MNNIMAYADISVPPQRERDFTDNKGTYVPVVSAIDIETFCETVQHFNALCCDLNCSNVSDYFTHSVSEIIIRLSHIRGMITKHDLPGSCVSYEPLGDLSFYGSAKNQTWIMNGTADRYNMQVFLLLSTHLYQDIKVIVARMASIMRVLNMDLRNLIISECSPLAGWKLTQSVQDILYLPNPPKTAEAS